MLSHHYRPVRCWAVPSCALLPGRVLFCSSETEQDETSSCVANDRNFSRKMVVKPATGAWRLEVETGRSVSCSTHWHDDRPGALYRYFGGPATGFMRAVKEQLLTTFEMQEQRAIAINSTCFTEKQRWVTSLAAKFSGDFARVMAQEGRVSEVQDLNRLYTFLLWKLDWFVDTFPEWKDGNDSSDSTLPELDRLAFFARDDVSKFGAVMKNVGAANETYSELVSKVDSHFGVHADQVLAEMDKAIHHFIKHTDVVATPEGTATAKKEITLDMYMKSRMWTGGLVPIAGTFWFGHEVPQDGQVEDSAMLCAIVNDLYDYPRDVEEDTHLNVWNYFDSVDNAISFVKGLFDDVYSRVSPDMQSWIDRYMLYQKDEDVQSLRGFDREWYNKLNAFFS